MLPSRFGLRRHPRPIAGDFKSFASLRAILAAFHTYMVSVRLPVYSFEYRRKGAARFRASLIESRRNA